MAKMYYTEQEAAEKLGVTPKEMASMAADKGLRSFMDSGRKVYKAEDIDKLAGADAGESGEIELTPLSGDTADVVSLSEADESQAPTSKEDTVITAEGISIFDDEDLEIETADPLAKTQIAPSVEDQVLVEGIGSGSGLLDLTRESDDTSLGAEVLQHIDMEGSVAAEEEAGPPMVGGGYAPQPEPVAPVYVEATDASSGLFGGVAVGGALLSLLLIVLMFPAVGGVSPEFLQSLRENSVVVIIVGIVVAAICGVVGYLMGKSMATRQRAMGR